MLYGGRCDRLGIKDQLFGIKWITILLVIGQEQRSYPNLSY